MNFRTTLRRPLTLVLLGAGLLISSTLPGSTALGEEAASLSWSLRAVQERAVEESLMLEQLRQGVAAAEAEAQAARLTSRRLQDVTPEGLQGELAKEYNAKAAERKVEQAKLSLQNGELAVRKQAAMTYWGVQLARRNADVARSGVNLAQEQEKLAQLALEAGTVSKIDPLMATTNLRQMEANLRNADKDTQLAEWGLLRLLGLEFDVKELKLTDSLPEPKVPDTTLAQLRELALSRNVAYKAARDQVELAKIRAEAVASYYPGTSQERTARAEVARAEAALKSARLDVELSARTALLELQTAYANLESARQAVAAAEEAERLERLRYEAGVATSTQVLDAQNRLEQAQLGYQQALTGYHQRLLDVEYIGIQ